MTIVSIYTIFEYTVRNTSPPSTTTVLPPFPVPALPIPYYPNLTPIPQYPSALYSRVGD